MKRLTFVIEEVEEGKVSVSFASEGFSNYEIIGFLETQKLDILMDAKKNEVKVEEGEGDECK